MNGCEIVCPEADRERRVAVRPLAHLRGDEQLARHGVHRGQDAGVLDPAVGELELHHPAPLLGEVRLTRHGQRPCGRRAPRWSSTACFTSVMLRTSASIPTVSTGTSESPRTSEPWLPPADVVAARRGRSSSTPSTGDTISSPAFGLASAAHARARPSG